MSFDGNASGEMKEVEKGRGTHLAKCPITGHFCNYEMFWDGKWV